MKKEQPNYKIHYSNEEHAIEMFDLNYEYFEIKNDEFDILPYAESYYRENSECFRENDKIEIMLFIEILKEKDYIKQTGNRYNIVRITKKGKDRISFIKDSKLKHPYS